MTGTQHLAFEGLLHKLRTEGFAIGIDDYLRVSQLLESQAGRTDPGRLRTLLGPLLAHTPDEQTRFYRIFQQYYAAPLQIAEPALNEPLLETKPGRQSRTWTYLSLAFVAVAMLLTLLLVFRPWEKVPSKTRHTQKSSVSGQVADGTPNPPTQKGTPTPDRPLLGTQPARIGVRANLPDSSAFELLKKFGPIPLILFSLYCLWMAIRRGASYLRRDEPKPRSSRFLRDDPMLTPIYTGPALLRNIRRMRRWLLLPTGRLDVPRTIRSTLAKAGLPQLEFTTGKQRPEYLALIDRSSGRDHQTALFSQLVRDLSVRGQLVIDSYFYSGDPRVCTHSKTGKSTYLDELLGRNYRRQVLVFGDGAALWNSFTSEWASWAGILVDRPFTALLTPQLEDWGPREEALRSRMVVRPATMDGLAQVLDELEGRATTAFNATGEGPPEYPAGGRPQRINEYVRQLRQYLGKRNFEWLSVCSLYAYLDTNLTVHLGRALDPTLLDHSNALKLFGLPWFRKGAFPLALQQALWQGLDPKLRRRMNDEIIRLMESGATSTDSGSALEVVVQRFGLSPMERRQLERDEVRAKLALTAGRGKVAVRLPSALRNRLFHYGVPGLGLQRSTFAALALLTVALAGAAVLVRPPAGSLLATITPPSPPLGWDNKTAVVEYISGPFQFAGTNEDIQFTPDQSRVVTLNRAGGKVFATIWDAQDGRAVFQLAFPTKGTVLASALSVDGSAAIFSTSEPAVEVWKIADRQQMVRKEFGPAKKVTLSGDGSVFAAADSRGAVVWDLSHELFRQAGATLDLFVTANGRMALIGTNLLARAVMLPSGKIVFQEKEEYAKPIGLKSAKPEVRGSIFHAIADYKAISIDGDATVGDFGRRNASGAPAVADLTGSDYVDAAVSGNTTLVAAFSKNQIELGRINWASLSPGGSAVIPTMPVNTNIDVTGAHVVMDYTGKRFAAAWPNGKIKVFPVSAMTGQIDPRLTQTESLLGNGAGSFLFGMTPAEVNAHLPVQFQNTAWESLPVASEYSPSDIHYFWTPLSPFTAAMFGLDALQSWKPCWTLPQSYATFLFSAGRLFRVSLRLYPDCGQRVELLRQLAKTIGIQDFNEQGPVAFRTDLNTAEIAGYLGGGMASFEIYSPGSPRPVVGWIQDSSAWANAQVGCQAGFVWREAAPNDHVCVTGATRQQVLLDNQAGPTRTGKDDICIQGYVWREATSTDHVCVLAAVRDQAKSDNAQAKSRLASPAQNLAAPARK